MIAKLIAIIMCIVSVFPGPLPMLFSEMELKYELSQGNYESPYIVRPLTEITVNGIDVDEYVISAPEGDIYALAADTLNNELHKALGRSIPVEKRTEKAFIIEESLNADDTFTLEVESGNIYLTGSGSIGISRGISAFADEVLLKADAAYDFADGYTYTKVFSDYVTYEQFGAVGDGKADDLEAVVRAHSYANENGLSVLAKETATYYIGGKAKTAVIKTDTDWSTARFIIDDTAVERIGSWIFNVAPTEGSYSITDKVAPLKMDAASIGTTLPGESLVVLTDSNVKRYIRKGANQNSGSNQSDVILVDKDGNISPDTPLIWDFDAVTGATVYPVDKEILTIKGGRFTTIANAAPSEYTYYTRGIQVRRSNTVIDGIYHDVINEGKTGAPYSAFVSLSCCANVTVKNGTFTGHKKYATIGSAGTSVQMGTYDIGAATAVNATFLNCKQTNDITNGDYWGIAGTNYCKNLTYDGCAFSRFDAHQGVRNATIKNSVLGHHGIKLIGMGTALIENTTVVSSSFVDLREDYGSTWNGDLIIRNCKFYPTGIENNIVNAVNTENHDFGYTCYMPQNIEIDGFFIHSVGFNFVFSMVNSKHLTSSYEAKYPVVAPKKITVKNFSDLSTSNLFVSANTAIFEVDMLA